ncbi:hypothetical protein PTKIN_Ptkin02bG0082500 [Pterospermum kingtungense]
MIILAEATTQSVEAKVDGAKPPTTLDFINEMIGETQRAKAKVSVLGNSQMVHDCDKAYGLTLDYLNKAANMAKASGTPNTEEVKTNVKEALKAIDSCDYSYAESTRPTPFIVNNAELKALGNKCLHFDTKW